MANLLPGFFPTKDQRSFRPLRQSVVFPDSLPDTCTIIRPEAFFLIAHIGLELKNL